MVSKADSEARREDPATFRELTLLVVDDDPDLRLYVRQCMSTGTGRFRRVIEAADGESGLTLLRAERPDVVVCDVLMPRLGGYDLCERLRADPTTSGTPLLLLTGADSSDDTLRRAEEAGADGVLLKPFNARRLRAAVDDAIRARAAIRPGPARGPGRKDSGPGEEP